MTTLINKTSVVFPDGTSQSTATVTPPDGSFSTRGIWRLATAAENSTRTSDISAITTASLYHSKLLGCGGYNSYWQNVTGSRALNVTYTNSSSRAIMLSVTGQVTSSFTIVNIFVDGTDVSMAGGWQDKGGAANCAVCIVPAASTYRVTSSTGGFSHWAETAIM